MPIRGWMLARDDDYYGQIVADLQGYVVIPKSVSQKRIVSNSQLFDFALTEEEMEEVRSPSTHALITAGRAGRISRH